MRRLDIDFRAQSVDPKLARGLLAGGATLLVAMIALGFLFKQLTPAKKAVLPAVVAQVPVAKLSPADQAAIAQARQRITLPWDGVFLAVEESLTADVALLEFSPDPARGELRLVAEARTLAAMLDYQGRLALSSVLGEVTIVSHEVVADNPHRPVRFTLTTRWVLS